MLKEGEEHESHKNMACSLNPYFNGTCSKRYIGASDQTQTALVLILILMEHAQREALRHVYSVTSQTVLILILMEHAQREPLVLQRF